jgi:TRAP-type C4-dicarboxylate transport system permease small subunit
MVPFERRSEKLAPVPVFIKRMAASLGMAVLLIALVLMVGIAGYHSLAGFEWVDSLLEASMILGGMGPIKDLPTSGAKVFASFYAIFCGLFFIGIMGIVLAPVVHRMLHKFHVDEKDLKKGK